MVIRPTQERRRMKEKILKWLLEIFPKGEARKELRKQIKIVFPGYHLAKNPVGRKKKVVISKEIWDEIPSDEEDF